MLEFFHTFNMCNRNTYAWQCPWRRNSNISLFFWTISEIIWKFITLWLWQINFSFNSQNFPATARITPSSTRMSLWLIIAHYYWTLPTNTDYCPLLLTIAHFSWIFPTIPEYSPLFLDTTHYYWTLPTNTDYCPLLLNTVHYYWWLPTITEYRLLLLNTAHYYWLLLLLLSTAHYYV